MQYRHVFLAATSVSTFLKACTELGIVQKEGSHKHRKTTTNCLKRMWPGMRFFIFRNGRNITGLFLISLISRLMITTSRSNQLKYNKQRNRYSCLRRSFTICYESGQIHSFKKGHCFVGYYGKTIQQRRDTPGDIPQFLYDFIDIY